MMTVFVLVHGANHDGSLLAPVVRSLGVQGHLAYAPTLAGHGQNVPRNVSHDDCVRSLTAYIDAHALNDLVLVGHSFAGSVISRAAPLIAQRLRRLVFLSAFVPNDGESILDAVPPLQRAGFEALAAESADNTITLPFPVWREVFINDADLETARATYALLSPEPYSVVAEKLDMKPFYDLIGSGRIPCSFINCTEDICMSYGPEWGWHPRMTSRLGLCRLVQMPGSHEVLFTNPDGLAKAIILAGRD
jgi:pimeloyl-ACP methyl ester carboxylesterase